MSARACRAMATLAVLAAVVWLAGPSLLLERLSTANAAWVALAALMLVAQIWLSALRWQVTAQALGTPVPRGWAIAEYHLSVLGNTLLPGGVMGDLGRAARARGQHGGVAPRRRLCGAGAVGRTDRAAFWSALQGRAGGLARALAPRQRLRC